MPETNLFESERLTLDDSIRLTIESLVAHGSKYRHWAAAFSGGKDSSALVTLLVYLIASGQVPAPETFTVLYADTRMELPPLQISAIGIMDALRSRGIRAQVVLPAIDDRFFVYMFGRGVPPPSNTFRWCTPQLKIEPMEAALKGLRDEADEKLLMFTGVRQGESVTRDARIALSCSRDGAECGQGWFQKSTPAAIADTLAPIVHWRICHVWDWLEFHAPHYGFPTTVIAESYGLEEKDEINARTGCVGCNLASRDVALETLLKQDKWIHLAPLRGLRPLYAELKKPHNRLRKPGGDRRKDGELASNQQRMGPLTFEARLEGLESILQIQREINAGAVAQGHPAIDLVNSAEEARIHELVAAGTWPDGWEGTEPIADVLLDKQFNDGSVQPLMGMFEV